MELRSGALAERNQLQGPAQEAFEEGVGLIFSQWTALCLAVENEWGGPMSRDKADQLIDDVIQWFYKKREHNIDDLEFELHQGMVEEFNTEVEDGSSMQVAGTLLELYGACCRGDASVLARLQQQEQQAAAAGTSMRQQMEDDVSSSTSDEEGDAMDADMGDAAAGGMHAPQAVPLEPTVPQAPLVDADGFQTVQARRKGRR